MFPALSDFAKSWKPNAGKFVEVSEAATSVRGWGVRCENYQSGPDLRDPRPERAPEDPAVWTTALDGIHRRPDAGSHLVLALHSQRGACL